MAVIPFDIGENVYDLLTNNLLTIEGLTFQSGTITKQDGQYHDCITIFTDKGVRSEKEVRKLDECEREYIEYATKLRRAV